MSADHGRARHPRHDRRPPRRHRVRGARVRARPGYVAGGISPLGQRRALPTLLDETALEHDTVFVSGGRRGLEIELDPRDLVALTGARVRALRR